MVKIYKQPFAHDGDAIAIPDASQPDGKMSSADGWTPDYQLPKTDPNYKPVGRQEMNGVLKEVTESLGQVQVQGSATWSADGAPYPANAQVYHNGKQWLALRANSVAPVEGADWSAIGTAATRDVGTSAGNVMEVRAFGLGVVGEGNIFNPQNATGWQNLPQGFRAFLLNSAVGKPTGLVHGYLTVIARRDVGDTSGLYVQEYNGFRAWVGNQEDGMLPTWSEILHTGSLLQTTGQSTEFPMSQKAVTDALSAVNDHPSMTGSATLNGTTDNTVQLTDIVTTLGLEVGDVIRIQYSGYNKLHTVESITNNNSIIVNYEHAGNRGNGSLKLSNTTASATITRIAKWYNAPVGLGQAWVNVAYRATSTTYINTTGRTIEVRISIFATHTKMDGLVIDGLISPIKSSPDTATDMSVNSLVTNKSEYKMVITRVNTWQELR